MAERVRDATQRSERLLEGLLTLTRSEREPSRREPADLADAAPPARRQAPPPQRLVAPRPDGGWAVVRVPTGGRPTPPDRVESLFEPFRRLDDRVASSA